MGELFVTVNGKNYEVEVSSLGNFFDKATKTYTAKTLAGLQRCMSAKLAPVGIQVQDINGKIGKVIGRIGGKGWNRNYFSVIWPDDSNTPASGSTLFPILTDAQKAEIESLRQAVTNAEDEVRVRRTNLNNHLNSLSISDKLDVAFPTV